MSHKSCEERVEAHLESRLDDLGKLWEAYSDGEEDIEDLGNIFEYGLCFDYVRAGTFTDQREGFFRYQLSTGGPGDEFRFYTDATLECFRIEYWFLDWFDGACLVLAGDEEEMLLKIWNWLKDGGAVGQAIEES